MAVLNPYNYNKPANMRPVTTVRPQTRTENNSYQTTAKQNKGDQYLEQKVMTASPEELTLMLYEGAIKFTKQAKIFNEEKNIEKTSNAILRVTAIYGELQATLNVDYSVSAELDRLYDYILHRLSEANIQKDGAILDEILEMSIDFRDTWKEAMKLAGK